MKITRVTGKLSRSDIDRLIGRASLADEAALAALAVVRRVVTDVRREGDVAISRYTKEFDKVELTADRFEVGAAEIEEARAAVGEDVLFALREAVKNVKAFSEMQVPSPWMLTEEPGASVGERVVPLSCVGIYVPGGRASYPSTVVMNAVPARAAGVEEIVMCVPPGPKAQVNGVVLAAAAEAGVDRIFKVGGAQAIAALAYGTETIPAVDKITGPGNIYVTLAKREVFGDVGIDMLAGPSEVVIIAEGRASADLIAQDMKAQAEHDPAAIAVLITPSEALAEAVRAKVEAANAQALLVRDITQAVEVTDLIAPEHLEIMTDDPGAVMEKVKNAGAVFLGDSSPTALGDYMAGPNHTLPTGGTARFGSPLSACDFVKRASVISYTPEALAKVAEAAAALARAEGLEEHARSIEARQEKNAKNKR